MSAAAVHDDDDDDDIYFQHWDLAPHNMGLNGSRLQIVILLDFNKCYMVIFIKIDFFP